MLKKLLLFTILLALTLPAWAQQIKVSTGDSKSGSTYSRMFRELAAKCRELGEINLQEFESSGSIQNVDRLVANETQAAIVQTDVIYLQSRTDDRLNNVKTLFTLHPEEIHVVAHANAQYGGTMGFGGHPLLYVHELAGKKVGAAGGSVMTAKVMQLMGEVPFSLVEFGSTGEALKALGSKEVDAVIAVGGAPLGAVDNLTAAYRLLSFDNRTMEKLKQVYVPAKLNYRKLSDSTGIPTLATEAILVVQNYKSPKVVTSLAHLRACIRDSLDELRDEPGTHAKWKTVNLDNKGKWLWYDLPDVQPAGKKR